MKTNNTTEQRWRFHLVWLLLAMLLVVLVARIVNLQVIDIEGGYKFLQAQGLARTVRTETIRAHRGIIFDRHGEPLAVSTPVVSISANPRVVPMDHAGLAKAAKVLGMSSRKLKARLAANKGRSFIYLKRRMPPADADKILALRIPGVQGTPEYKRYYPAGEVTSHLLGFTNIDDQGQEGIELTYNEHLRGTPGAKQVVKDLLGNTISDYQHVRSAEPGNNLQLTIDLRIQYLAYRALKRAVQRSGAASGSLVLADVHTGDILAMVNEPAFNPNNRAQFKPSRLRNRAVIDLIEPGSTVKPFTMVAALESGKFSPRTEIDTSPGHFRVGRKTYLDPVNYGVVDLTKIITKSSQVGMTKVALALEGDDIRSVFHRLGLGQATGTGFPGEGVGMLPSPRHWKDLEKVTLAFGYSLSVTPLQLVQAYSVLGNSGERRPLRILSDSPQVPGEQVIAPAVSDAVLDMLKTVALEGGTAQKAAIPAYSFAGKTGTVHKAGVGGYLEDQYMAYFAGLAPANNPRIVGVVVINEPKGEEYHGGQVAAPAFAGVIGDALRLTGVAPDKLEDFKSETLLAQDLEVQNAGRG